MTDSINYNDIDWQGLVPQPKASYQDMLSQAAAQHGVSEYLPYLQQMLNVESGGDPKAKSRKGASGLMQLMPGTAKAMGVKNINDPMENITGGVKYFAQNLKEFGGDVDLALAAYNAGPNAVRRYKGVPPFKETKSYLQKIKGAIGDFILPKQAFAAEEEDSDFEEMQPQQQVQAIDRSDIDWKGIKPPPQAQGISLKDIDWQGNKPDKYKGTLEKYTDKAKGWGKQAWDFIANTAGQMAPAASFNDTINTIEQFKVTYGSDVKNDPFRGEWRKDQRNCGGFTTTATNRALASMGVPQNMWLPKDNLGVGQPKYLAEKFGSPLISSREKFTPEMLMSMGPGTVIAGTKPEGGTHAEMIVAHPVTGEPVIASYGRKGETIQYKTIDDRYTKRLNAGKFSATNPFQSQYFSGQMPQGWVGKPITAPPESDISEDMLTTPAGLPPSEKLPPYDFATTDLGAMQKQIGGQKPGFAISPHRTEELRARYEKIVEDIYRPLPLGGDIEGSWLRLAGRGLSGIHKGVSHLMAKMMSLVGRGGTGPLEAMPTREEMEADILKTVMPKPYRSPYNLDEQIIDLFGQAAPGVAEAIGLSYITAGLANPLINKLYKYAPDLMPYIAPSINAALTFGTQGLMEVHDPLKAGGIGAIQGLLLGGQHYLPKLARAGGGFAIGAGTEQVLNPDAPMKDKLLAGTQLALPQL